MNRLAAGSLSLVLIGLSACVNIPKASEVKGTTQANQTVLPFSSMKELFNHLASEPSLLSCGQDKMLISVFAVTGKSEGRTMYRLLVRQNSNRFFLSLHNLEGTMIYSWVGTMKNDEDTTFVINWEGDRVETLKRMIGPCDWLYQEAA